MSNPVHALIEVRCLQTDVPQRFNIRSPAGYGVDLVATVCPDGVVSVELYAVGAVKVYVESDLVLGDEDVERARCDDPHDVFVCDECSSTE